MSKGEKKRRVSAGEVFPQLTTPGGAKGRPNGPPRKADASFNPLHDEIVSLRLEVEVLRHNIVELLRVTADSVSLVVESLERDTARRSLFNTDEIAQHR